MWRWLFPLAVVCALAGSAQAQAPRLAPGARPYTQGEQLRLRESQLEILRDSRSRLRLGPPIAALSVSWLLSGAMASMLVIDTGNSSADATFAVASSLGVISALGAVASTVWLTRVVRERRELGREIHRLERTRFGLSLGHNRGEAQISFRF